ncbi:ferredoxin [Kutzneria buriramensis]|uniref:Ferredoxin n=1 Tax=Kutzneria buriramensis TaxID=1045776 RepID=A0A3E0GZX9_9PSEU|nr:ferredoxin [Kutzneria buriramensis]REH34943.1 ferredoxin [Kutzneria buriramensis]
MRVEVDHTRCAAVGRCAGIAPEVFDQREDDGVVILLDAAPPDSDRVREAALLCPAAAIVVHENAAPTPGTPITPRGSHV